MNRRRLSVSALAMSATAFRWEHCPLATGAMDLEVIMEHDLEIEIVPEVDLQKQTGGKVGSLSANGQQIRVDATFQSTQPKEYKCFLAHELGHRTHHLHLVSGKQFSSRESFVGFHNSIDEVLESQLEDEARTFGMHLLMPRKELRVVFSQAVDLARDRFDDVCSGAAKLFTHRIVANHFDVLELRVESRVTTENLWKEVRRQEYWRAYARAAEGRKKTG